MRTRTASYCKSRRRLRKFDGGLHAFPSNTGNQHLLRRCRFCCNPQHIARLLVVERYRLARGAQHHHARKQAAGIARNIGLELAEIDPLVWVKRRGYRRKDAFNQHIFIVGRNAR